MRPDRGYRVMLYAHDPDGLPIRAEPGAAGTCAGCSGQLIPHCGEIKAWHWSHQAGPDCDPWHEPESNWHLAWKARFPPWCTEVTLGPHRADVKVNGRVVEFQHSSLSVGEIQEREAFYGPRMIWVVDSAPFLHNLSIRMRDGYYSFRWRWPRPSHTWFTRPLYWDLRDGQLMRVRKLHGNGRGGWGYIQRDEALMAWLLKNAMEGAA